MFVSSCWMYNVLHVLFITLFGATMTLGQSDLVDMEDALDYGDLDGLPGVMFHFKMEVGPGTQECFFQKMKLGAELIVAFEVLKGADRNVDFIIKKPDGTILDSHLWTSKGTTEVTIEIEGDYSICIDNSFSRFTRKLLYLFMSTYVPSEWQQLAEEAEEADLSLTELQKGVERIQDRIRRIKYALGLSNRMGNVDMYMAKSNMSNVQNWSLIMVAIIVISGVTQVYFVKHMFKSVNVTPSQKPRA